NIIVRDVLLDQLYKWRSEFHGFSIAHAGDLFKFFHGYRVMRTHFLQGWILKNNKRWYVLLFSDLLPEIFQKLQELCIQYISALFRVIVIITSITLNWLAQNEFECVWIINEVVSCLR